MVLCERSPVRFVKHISRPTSYLHVLSRARKHRSTIATYQNRSTDRLNEITFIAKTPAKTPISPVSPTGQAVEWHGVNRERVDSGRVRLATPGSPVTHHWPAHLGDHVICGQRSPWKESFFRTYNLLNHTYFFHRILYRLYKRLYLNFT